MEAHLAEMADAGMSRTDALLHLVEWAIRGRPRDEVEQLLEQAEGHQQAMAPEQLGDLRWLQAFAALRAGRYAETLVLVVPLSRFDLALDRVLGPHERGPQVLASVLIAQAYRELGARAAAVDEASRALDWLGDLGATDFASCAASAGQVWKGAHLLGFELAAGLAEDTLAEGDLDQARAHVVAARRWLPRRALREGTSGVAWWHRITLLLLWSKLSLARGWGAAAASTAERALALATRYQALPYVARCWYQRGLALLGAPFDPVRYALDALDLDGGPPLPQTWVVSQPLAAAAVTAETAGMAELACAAHLTLAAVFTPHDRQQALVHLDRAVHLAEDINDGLPLELGMWWELSRMTPLRLADIAVRHVEHNQPPPPDDVSALDAAVPQGHGVGQPMPRFDDVPQPPDLEAELRDALRHAGYALADETGAGAVIAAPRDGRVGLVVRWQVSSALDEVEASLSAGLIMKQLATVLDALGFLARPDEREPGRLLIEGTYSPMLGADDADGGDRATRWCDRETQGRHAQLGWLADAKIYDAATTRPGIAGHPLRDLVVRVLVTLDGAGLPLQVDTPDDGAGGDIGVSLRPHAIHGSVIAVSWEPSWGNTTDYQRQVFRAASRALIERILNAAGIVTNGRLTDGAVYVVAPTRE